MCPMLGHGDLLRKFEVSVGDLLNRSEDLRRQWLLCRIVLATC